MRLLILVIALVVVQQNTSGPSKYPMSVLF